jgi:hypothetical protein
MGEIETYTTKRQMQREERGRNRYILDRKTQGERKTKGAREKGERDD